MGYHSWGRGTGEKPHDVPSDLMVDVVYADGSDAFDVPAGSVFWERVVVHRRSLCKVERKRPEAVLRQETRLVFQASGASEIQIGEMVFCHPIGVWARVARIHVHTLKDGTFSRLFDLEGVVASFRWRINDLIRGNS